MVLGDHTRTCLLCRSNEMILVKDPAQWLTLSLLSVSYYWKLNILQTMTIKDREGFSRWTIALQMQNHNWVWHVGSILGYLYSIEADISQPPILCHTLYSRLWGHEAELQKQYIYLKASQPRARTPLVIRHQSYVLQSNTFPSQCCFSCIPSFLAWCIFIPIYLKEVLISCVISSLALTHLC